MVVVRESPVAKAAVDRNAPPEWPPASPFQALLSSPGGRKRWQDQQKRTSQRTPSPSPVRRAQSNGVRSEALEPEGDDEEEDEELLKLKLQQIEARLKLKRLQKAKNQSNSDVSKESGDSGASQRARAKLPMQNPVPQFLGRRVETEDQMQVPVSPKKLSIPQEPPSPARRRLGLEPVQASSVSLKRARDGTQLPRSSSTGERRGPSTEESKPLSFSERLARSKESSRHQQDKQERLVNVRSQGFGSHIAQNATERSSFQIASINNIDPSTDRLPAISHRSGTAASIRANPYPDSHAETLTQQRGHGNTSENQVARAEPHYEPPASTKRKGRQRAEESDQESSAGFDAFSQVHLSKRHLPHIDIARELADKEIYTIPRLFKEVVSPHYDPPDCESDFVVFAILASKSSPYDQKSARHTSDQNKPQEDADGPRNKFMVLHLTDLKWELDCFLFGTGFDQFWKLTPGTLIAILNPGIMPPKGNQHSGNFSLKLSSCEDKIMEIGVARDLSYCVSKKKDGQQCTTWIDKRHTTICDFHLNLMIDRNRKHRMEVNGMWRGKGDDDNRTKSMSGAKGSFDRLIKDDQKSKGTYHSEYGRLYSVPNGYLKSAANLLDAEDTDALHNMTKEEASRKRIAAAQKERDLAKKLAEIGNGAGAEYLRAMHPSTTPKLASSDAGSLCPPGLFDKPKASDLGLLNNKATEQHLSPAKDRKRHFGIGAISSAGSQAVGWGGARKPGLLQAKDNKLDRPEKGQTTLDPTKGLRSSIRERSQSPRKRARFALEQGIREPGRESLGDDLLKLKDKGSGNNDDYDDDDLDIV